MTHGQTLGSAAPGGSASTTATIKGGAQSVTLSTGTLPTGVTVAFTTNPVGDSSAGVTDGVTIHVAPLTAPGSYIIKIIATGADGQKSTATYTLTVT